MRSAIEIAKDYFDLSNERNLVEIEKLFTPSSTYSSANTGVYLGADQIMEMQALFFASFEKMSWNIHGVDEIRPGVVLFDFTFTGVTLGGEKVTRPGLEYVIVFNGELQHVEVRNKG